MISYALESGGSVKVYDQNNHLLFVKSGNLQGYTSTSVTVISSSGRVSVYDDKGHILVCR